MKVVIGDTNLAVRNKKIGYYDFAGVKTPVICPVVSLEREFSIGEENKAMEFAVKLEKFVREHQQ